MTAENPFRTPIARGFVVGAGFGTQLTRAKSGCGTRLPASIQRPAQAGLGKDLNAVRLHHDDRAAFLAQPAAPSTRAVKPPMTAENPFRTPIARGFVVGAGFGTQLTRAKSGCGTRLPASIQRPAQAGLGKDLSAVRLHHDDRAAFLAQSVGANAFTIGRDIFFAKGMFQPSTLAGKRLIAHELAHVAQQSGARSALRGRVQRQKSEQDKQRPASATPEQLGDTNFLLCMLLCYFGLPPRMWRDAVELLLSGISAEYQATRERVKADSDFRKAKLTLATLSPLFIANSILTFATTGRIAKINLTIRSAQAKVVRRVLLRFLLTRVAPRASLSVAAQIVRKAALAVEVAIAAGCLTFCGGTAFIRAVLEATAAFGEALAVFSDIAPPGGLAGQLIAKPILRIRATIDPLNQQLSSAMSSGLRADVATLLNFLWIKLGAGDVEKLVTGARSTLGSLAIPQSLITDVAQGLQDAAKQASGLSFVITTDLLLGLNAVGFVDLLRLLQLLSFKKSPHAIAERQLQTSTAQ